jgi:formylglycine-generating enzyme required for sulfatase activity
MQNHVPAILAALVATASFAQERPAVSQSDLEAEIAKLKTETVALVTAGRTALDALTPEQRLVALPAIWRVVRGLTAFRDCENCPNMVVVPAGEFTMGAPAAELGGESQHRVRIEAPFAVSKFEITFAEWDTCVAAGGCRGYRPGDEGWGRGTSPAMNISWEDAKAYAAWLSAKTGKTYRLLSEAEWEYAARAGTVAAYPYADGLSPGKANYDASTDGSGPSDVNRQRTVPVGGFQPNAFGLFDMQGNVSEWVEDCWNDDYTAAAPTDGSAWLAGDCKGHVVRGGSWEDSASELRSAARTGGAKDDRFYTDGVRIARSL